MNEYQKEAWKTAVYPNKKNNIYYPAMGVGGEAGEVLNKVQKIMRDHEGKINEEKKQELIQELGDLLWYAAAMATELNINMGDIAQNNLKKLSSRAIRDKIKGSGDNR